MFIYGKYCEVLYIRLGKNKVFFFYFYMPIFLLIII